MNPFFFGDSDAPLFGVYHPPAGRSPRDEAVLLCYPGCPEYVWVHRVYRRLADRLCAAGFHVFRFDYHGVGDSAGETGSGGPERWKEDVAAAAAELRENAGTVRVSCVALRLGAVHAARACADGLELDNLVLWDPVIRGEEYLEELAALHRRRVEAFGEGRTEARLDGEMLGYPMCHRARSEFAKVDLLDLSFQARGRVLLLLSEETPSATALRSRLAEGHAVVDYRVIAGARDRQRIDSLARIPRPVLDMIVEFLEGGE